MTLLLLLPSAFAAAATVAFSRPGPSRVRASHLPSAFPRLRKYGSRRRRSEPVAAPSFDDDDDEDMEVDEDDDGEEEPEVDEEEFLATRPKPVGFGAGKVYSTDIEEQLLRGLGGGARPKGEKAPAKRRAGDDSGNDTGAGITDGGVQVRVWNLPKKKNIHKDLKQAFKGFPGLLDINPAVSGSKKTRDPVCKGFAFLKMQSVETATRFVEMYSRKNVLFGKVEKPISCCVVEAQSSTDPSVKASNSQKTLQPKSKHKNLVTAS